MTKKRNTMANLQPITGIYKITSPSGRIYIGQSVDIKNRWSQHRRANDKQQLALINSFNKYGVQSHIFEIVEICTFEELNNRERYWQDLYDVLKYGLNCVLTSSNSKKAVVSEGTRKKMQKEKPAIRIPVLQYTQNGYFKALWPSIKSAGITGVSPSLISACVRGEYKTSGGYMWLRYNGGAITKKIPAVNYTRNPQSKTHIQSRVLATRKGVFQYDFKGNLIKEWESITEAAKSININGSNIGHCLSGVYKSAGGYVWKPAS